MKRLHMLQLVVAGMAVGGFWGSVRSEDSPKRDVAKRPILERILKEFDKDGSGRLNRDELVAARKALEHALAQISEKGDEARSEVSNAKASSPDVARPNLKAVLKRFDKDGDGKLSDEETAAALKPRDPQGIGNNEGRPNFQEMLKRFDKDGDGKLNGEEQAAARAAFEQRRGGAAGGGLIPGEGKQQEAKVDRRELLKKFDKDGDGQLSAEEKAAAREAFQNRESPKKE